MQPFDQEYHEQGSLPPPRIIGRLVRLFLGIACLDLFRQIVDDIPGMIQRGWPMNTVAICTAVLGFYLLRPVTNLGFTLKPNHGAQIVVAAGTLLVVLYEWLAGMPLFGEPFTAFLMLWMAYVFGFLGISFVVAAIIKTPGCEMRSTSHLWSIITGKGTLEHPCPGFITHLDNWERGLSKR